jgi:hypothetical protein
MRCCRPLPPGATHRLVVLPPPSRFASAPWPPPASRRFAAPATGGITGGVPGAPERETGGDDEAFAGVDVALLLA